MGTAVNSTSIDSTANGGNLDVVVNETIILNGRQNKGPAADAVNIADITATATGNVDVTVNQTIIEHGRTSGQPGGGPKCWSDPHGEPAFLSFAPKPSA